MQNDLLILWEEEMAEKAMLKLLTETEQKWRCTHGEARCGSSVASSSALPPGLPTAGFSFPKNSLKTQQHSGGSYPP